jgi:hypothetical protein
VFISWILASPGDSNPVEKRARILIAQIVISGLTSVLLYDFVRKLSGRIQGMAVATSQRLGWGSS